MTRILGVAATVAVGAVAVFSLAACGSAVGLNAVPGGGDGGAGGASGAAGGTTGGAAGGSTTTFADGTGGWSSTVTSIDTVTVGTGGYGGYGGSGTTVGTGGFGGTGPRCIPGQSIGCICASGQMGAQVCQPDGTFGPCMCDVDGGSWEQEQLARLRRGIVGTWVGSSSNPWSAGCSALVKFEANGHYSAHSPGDDSCLVLYYGSNADSPEKTYVLNNVLASAEGEGDIEFWFSPGDTNRGQLRHVYLSADENVLAFEAWKEDHGPIVFKLMRVSR